MNEFGKVPETIDEVWEECLRVWEWIRDVKTDERHVLYGIGVGWLKDIWLTANGYTSENIRGGCFFCEWAKAGCPDCPGRKVDEDFDCGNGEYSFSCEPVKFYEKLCELNQVRTSSKERDNERKDC